MLQETLANDRENAAVPGSPDNVWWGAFSFEQKGEQTELQILGSRKPTHVASETTAQWKVTVWCSVSAFGVLGPYFFENATGQSVTVTSDRYVELLWEFLNDDLCRLRVHTRLVWFQQDGATAHTAQNSMTVVRGMFLQHVISSFGDIEWPARSPDLSACEFFLWGYLKEKVYAHRPHTIRELKDCIREEIQGIPVNMLRKVMVNVRQCAEMCLTANGAHLSDIIFKMWLENVMLFHVAYHSLASYDLIFN
jgi:hypothetical protein